LDHQNSWDGLPEQVDRFIQDVVEPIRQRYKGKLDAAVELKV
jgi:hypothetical protein